ncbi:MAG: phospholipase [Deltaproteobacteria bacterium]|nr:phospholipase [Deltaproteobacteria bacterium]
MTRPLLVPGETCATLIDAPTGGLLIDGHDFYRAVYEACCKAKRTIYMAGWQFASEVELVRGDEAANCSHPTKFLPFLRSLCERNPDLDIYLLPWDSSPVFTLEREPLQRLKFWRLGHKRIHWRMDNAHPPGASHHQKLICVDRAVAFVGGMDLCTSRWDDRDHAANKPQRCTKGKQDQPYHDIQAYVMGNGVDILRGWFAQRWERATGKKLEVPDAPTGGIAIEPTIPIAAPHVGLSRTLPPLEDPPCEPVTELLQLHLRAIGAAKRVIYIENQYLSSDELCRAIEARLASDGPKLEIVMVFPERSAGKKEQISIGVYQQAIFKRITEACAHYGHKLGVYFHAVPGDEGDVPVFIHAKVMAVDDRFLLCSSANTTNRSMTFDTELGIAWESLEENPTIRRARIEMIGEHCGVWGEEAEALVGPIAGLVDRLDAFAREKRGALRIHCRNADEAPGPIMSRILPPDSPFDPDSIEDTMPEPGTWLDRIFRNPIAFGGHLGKKLGGAVRRRATRSDRRSG